MRTTITYSALVIVALVVIASIAGELTGLITQAMTSTGL